MEGKTERQTDGREDRKTDIWMSDKTGRQMIGRTDKWIDGWKKQTYN